jgi:hypothetical protein
MSVEDRGHFLLASSDASRALGLGTAGAVAGFLGMKACGVRTVASTVGGVVLGAVAGTVGASRESTGLGAVAGGIEGVKVSLNLGEAVLFPMTAGVMMAMNKDADLRRDGFGLIGVGTLGLIVSYFALAKE